MSRISFFQKYTSPENHLTNNTLLILCHFYRHDSQKLKKILSELSEEDIDIGPVFEQQIKIKDSKNRPDALIDQKPLEIYFEVKHGEKFRKKQIEKYIGSINKDKDKNKSSDIKKILFLLTKDPIDNKINGELLESAKKNSIVFKAITFNDIIRTLRICCEDYEADLNYILDDYEQYLREENLLGTELTLVPVGTSMKENIELCLYYEPASRPSKASSKFFGLYTKKCVRHIGRVEAVVRGGLAGGKYKVEEDEIEFRREGYELGKELQRIDDAIRKCTYHPNIEQGHRFYLLSELKETEFHKESKGGMQKAWTRKLSDWLGSDDKEDKKEYDLDEVAEKLCDVKFK